MDEMIGMTEAARRLGLTASATARRLLEREGIPLVKLTPRMCVVSAAAVEALRQRRESYSGIGRPKKVGSDGGGEPGAS